MSFFSQITPKYKQNEHGVINFLKELKFNYKSKLKDLIVYVDSKFGFKPIKQYLSRNYSARPIIENYGSSLTQPVFTTQDLNIRKTIERVISRLEVYFSLKHPRLLKEEYVAIHAQLCVFCDLLLVLFNLFSGNHTSFHSQRDIRGKSF